MNTHDPHMRRVFKSIERWQRKTLRHKMDGYNTLAKRPNGEPLAYDSNKARTIVDVINDSAPVISHFNTRITYKRQSPTSERAAVSPEVRTLWQQKIGMCTMLSDDTRAKLAQMPRFSLREAKLNDLARWMVTQWCDVEGYDPGKHVRK